EYDFDPDILRLQQEHPSPLPRAVLWSLFALLGCLLLWALFGRLDIIAEAHGKLVPQSAVKIVQAADAGIVKELLVHEGDEVAEGQIVARMDPVYSEADGRTIESELHLKGLQLRRIDAELAGEDMLKTEDDPEALFAQVQDQFRAHRQAYQDALASAEATHGKADQDLKSALEIEQKLKRTLPSYRQQSEAFAKLVDKGYVSKLMADEKQRELIEREQDLRAQQHSVKSLRATIAQSEKQISQITSSYREELQNERIATASDYHRLKQESDKQIHRHGLLEVRASQAGIVKDISTHTPGTVVSAGTVLMTVVPMDDPLEAEVWVSHIDAGFVRAGQHARVKVSAYSFQKYGMLEGEVDQISPDAVDNEEAMRSGIQGYRATVSLHGNQLETPAGKRYALTPGMQVSAEIHLGSRSVIEYLLSPVQKAVFEAGRER
ncbi:MAG TPA: HlyD family type I secretion periplasmic adaptor subunit, partial [Mariprofundaceae bacterium]|nr:HlyD family type I secretion periplasmic adaptor subunit [Mariprofundaceae bacterium]